MSEPVIDPKSNPATLSLEQFKDWDADRLRELIERRHSSTFRYHDNDGGFRDQVFRDMPIRVIKLPEMELMERGAVAAYLNNRNTFIESKTMIKVKSEDATDASERSDFLRHVFLSPALPRPANPGFAILSHTWCQENEPTYENFNEQRERSKKGEKTLRGYQKLEWFCDIAHREYGVEFAWADTVCIDKSSSTELDESIRSMFAWYQNSAICIAYLGETTDLVDCSSDLWFTRGWTLQEILAPRHLKLYNKNWYPLTDFSNDKIVDLVEDEYSSFFYQLHLHHHAIRVATGLDMATVARFRPGIHDPSLPERMKWVARRATTRAEDKAYCMMGVFGVSMSTAYGEGAERAFFRLFTAILEIGCSIDWFIWGGKPVSSQVHPSRMIPSSPECYLHRDGIEEGVIVPIHAQAEEPIALTNLGLPMKVLVVPAKISYGPETAYFGDIHISCLLSNESMVIQDPALRWSERVLGISSRYALGILNVAGPKITKVPRRLYAILLQRDVNSGRTYSKWEKRETNKALVFRCSTGGRKILRANNWNAIKISRSKGGRSNEGGHPNLKFENLYL